MTPRQAFALAAIVAGVAIMLAPWLLKYIAGFGLIGYGLYEMTLQIDSRSREPADSKTAPPT